MSFKTTKGECQMKEIKNDKFIVRIHGEVNKEKLLSACKKYAEKVFVK